MDSSWSKRPHAVMFHHFHNNKHPKTQGSIDEQEFVAIIEWLKKNYNLLNADDYFEKARKGELKELDNCLSFDDSLLCQFEIAVPVLKRLELSAFFFVYSSPFLGDPDYLEIFRHFRNTSYDSINDFYQAFFEMVKEEIFGIYSANQMKFEQLNYLSEFPFYSYEDKWFRYLRDYVLTKNIYKKLMLRLMNQKNYGVSKASSRLWMKDEHLLELKRAGHVIGLHSYSHPTVITDLSFDEQKKEYETNLSHLNSVLGSGCVGSMSHPCGNYDANTLTILRELGISVGFRSNMSVQEIKSNLEIPREDHTNILKKIFL